MARYSSTVSIGNYGVASTFTVLVSFITFPFVNILFPIFSKMTGAKSREELEVAFRASVKYISFLVLPVTIGVMTLSQPLIGILFGKEYSLAPLFLVFMSIVNLFCGLGSLSMGCLLSSQGETKVFLKLGLLNMVVGMPLSLILIPYFGIIGFIVNSLVIQAVGTLLYIYWVKRLFKFKMWISQSVKIYVAAFIMGVFVWATISVLRVWIGVNNEIVLLVTGFLVGFLSYVLILLLIGGIELTDLENIKFIFAKFGFLTAIFNILYIGMKRIMTIRA